MDGYSDLLDELFVTKLGYEFRGTSLPFPTIDGHHNLISLSKAYSANGVDVIFAECNDRILEFQKKLIQSYKRQFPDSHFLFVSNCGNVFDLYNVSSANRLKKITYNEFDKNTRLFKEKIQLFSVEEAKGAVDLRVRKEKAFDCSDKITKKFYNKFQAYHEKLTRGIKEDDLSKSDKAWYASVLLNRIMFIYYLQKHRVIQDDYDFLLTKYEQVEKQGEDYYRDFLLPLFFYGFAKRDSNPHKQEFIKKFGYVSYLNGGLFYPHRLETRCTPSPHAKHEKQAFDDPAWIIENISIDVDGKVLKTILEFLNKKTWYINDRPRKNEDEVNPEMLGYIFEMSANEKERKQKGAYYTKEDITGYISKNTIIPFILDKLRCNGFEAPDPNPMITKNEDIIGNMLDYLEQLQDYDTLKFIYKDILLPLAVLDPAVGSGAFLFEALKILMSIYGKVVFKLRSFREHKHDDEWLQCLCATLENHSEEYFLTKQIILKNLYGVDIVEEATEICKLRLFLQLASQLSNVKEIEPLPDIDFNIYAGNSLVGGLNWDDLENNYTWNLFSAPHREKIREGSERLIQSKEEYKRKIDEQARLLTELKSEYKRIQQHYSAEQELIDLKTKIEQLESDINEKLAIKLLFGIDNPFHWFIEFNEIMERGGFDVIIGNPPYVEYSKVRKDYQISGYETVRSGNLYAYFIERSFRSLAENGRFGMIVQMSVCCTQRMKPVQDILKQRGIAISNFSWRPAKLFEGSKKVNISLSIITTTNDQQVYSTTYNKWYSEERDRLFSELKYVRNTYFRYEFIIPKIGSEIELKIYKKVHRLPTLGSRVSKSKTPHIIYYRTTGGLYWKVFTDFQPEFYKNGQRDVSSRETYLYLNSIHDLYAALSLLCSNFYWWWYSINSNGRDNNPFDIKALPIKNEAFENHSLVRLSRHLMISLQENSIMSERIHGDDVTVGQKFFHKLSKQLIDSIDDELAVIYELEENEVNFLKNYDYRYRMREDNE